MLVYIQESHQMHVLSGFLILLFYQGVVKGLDAIIGVIIIGGYLSSSNSKTNDANKPIASKDGQIT